MSQTKDIHSENQFWRYDPDCFNNMSASYFSSDYWHENHAIIGKETGRGTTLFVKHQLHQLVLRHYLRGGLMRHFSHDQYFFNGLQHTRSFAEYSILAQLRSEGFAVPKPAAAQVVRKGLLYRADLLTHKIPDAQDLVRVLQQAQTAEFYHQLGGFIAAFHQHGVYHADLNIQNILVDGGKKFWLIDFDRAEMRTPQANWRHANLKRLKRSFEKEVLRHHIKWSETDWKIFIDAYHALIGQ